MKQFKGFLHGSCGNQISAWAMWKSDFFSLVQMNFTIFLKMYGNFSMTIAYTNSYRNIDFSTPHSWFTYIRSLWDTLYIWNDNNSKGKTIFGRNDKNSKRNDKNSEGITIFGRNDKNPEGMTKMWKEWHKAFFWKKKRIAWILPQLVLLPPLGHKEAIGTLG